VADLSELRFLVEQRKDRLAEGKTVEGPWQLVAAFASQEHADNFAALKQLYGAHNQLYYRVVAA
jgi:hypothetical protein